MTEDDEEICWEYTKALDYCEEKGVDGNTIYKHLLE
jgi:hypothetical protein